MLKESFTQNQCLLIRNVFHFTQEKIKAVERVILFESEILRGKIIPLVTTCNLRSILFACQMKGKAKHIARILVRDALRIGCSESLPKFFEKHLCWSGSLKCADF